MYKKINFNKKYPENHSFCTTTLEGSHFTKINHKTQKPEKVHKKEFIGEIFSSAFKFLNNIAIMLEFDEEFGKKLPIEQQVQLKEILANTEKFMEPKNRKAFYNCINDMSYNFKDLIKNTWKLLQPVKYDFDTETDDDDNGEQLIDPNFNYFSDSD